MPTGGPSDPLIESVTFKAEGIEEVLGELSKLREESERLARTQGKAKEALQAYGDYEEAIRKASKAMQTFNAENQRYGDNQRYQRYDSARGMGGLAGSFSQQGQPFAAPRDNKPNWLSQHFNRGLSQHEQERQATTQAEADAKAKARADRVAEVRARVEDRQRQSISATDRLGDNQMNQAAVTVAIADLKKFKRELSDGTFRQAAAEAERLRATTAALMRQQAQLAREARRQELEARYGNRVGRMAYNAELLQPKLTAGIGAAANLGRWGNARAQAGMHGTVAGENLAMNEIAFNRKLADAQQGVNQVKGRLFKMGAKVLGQQGGEGQDALGWGMWGAQNAPEGTGRFLAQAGATGLSMLPGLASGALRLGGMAARFGGAGLSALGGGSLALGGLAAGAIGTAATAIAAPLNIMKADRYVAKREKGDNKDLDLGLDDPEIRKAMAEGDQNKRIKALGDARMKLARDQAKREGESGTFGNLIGWAWGSKVEQSYDDADKDARLRRAQEKARAGQDKDDVKAAQAAVAKAGDGKPGAGNGNRSSPIAAGGFEGLDETYMRQETAFSRLSGSEAGAEGKATDGTLTAAINRLIDGLENFFGGKGGANNPKDKIQRHA